jgi:PAS domain S-box-containing protein
MLTEPHRDVAGLRPGDHACLIYDDPGARREALVAYIGEGLARGDRCVYASDEAVGDVVDGLRHAGIDVDASIARGALRLLTRGNGAAPGELDARAMLDMVGDAVAAGFSGVRIAADMTEALAARPALTTLIEDATCVTTQLVSATRGSALCMYRRGRFPEGLLGGILRAHPLLVGRHRVVPNLRYAPAPGGNDRHAAPPEAGGVLLAELARSRSVERTLTAVLDAAPLAVVGVDLDDVVVFWNAAAERLLGWREHEAVGRSLPTVPDECPTRGARIREAVAGGRTVRGLETRRRRRDGTTVGVVASVAPLIDGEGAVRGTLEILAEVAEPEHGDDAARWLAAVVHSSDDAIVSKTLGGIITSWNAAAERMFGFTAQEAVGRPITIIIPPERVSEEDEVLRRIGRGETVDHFETVRRRKDGTSVDVSLTISPVLSASGRIMGASKIARDISARKSLERERAAVLARAQAARAEAEAANRLKDEFLAVLSHELRTPLTSAHGWTRLLRTQAFDETRLHKALDAIARSIDLQLHLVNDLLDVSALAAGKLQLQRHPVDLAEIVLGELESFKASAAASGIEPVVSIDAPVPIEADAARIQQVFGNLVSNAIKFTPAGGRVEVHVDRAGGEACLTVSDTGCGIAPEFLPHVFDKFRQAESTTTRRAGGLGLGLAIVRSIVELHGGRIGVESAGVGKGARFTVVLPLATGNDRTAAA